MRTVVVACVTALWSSLALSYETDVHLGLTKWLALAAGFTEQEADMIAVADQSLDESALIKGKRHDAVHVVTHEIIFESDPKDRADASKRVQDDHFSGSTYAPSDPFRRSVAAGPTNNPAIAIRLSMLEQSPNRKTDGWLTEVGFAMHTLQDTFSHAGVPDIPASPYWSFRSDFSWGHPDARGGWSRHRADITCADKESAFSMAEASFVQLQKFCSVRREKPCNSRTWTDFGAAAEQFIRAETKKDKRLWFQQQEKEFPLSASKRDFLSGTSLTESRFGGKRGQSTVAVCEPIKATLLRPSDDRVTALPPGHRGPEYDGWRFVRVGDKGTCGTNAAFSKKASEFVLWWSKEFLTYDATKRQDNTGTYRKRVQDFFDLDDLTRNLRALERPPRSVPTKQIPDTRDWIWTFLTLWLVKEHGVVEALGHGDPSDPLFPELDELVSNSHRRNQIGQKADSDLERAADISVPAFSETVHDVGDSAMGDFEGDNLGQAYRRGQCALVVQMPDRWPRDAVFFGFSLVPHSKAWKIVRIGWLSL